MSAGWVNTSATGAERSETESRKKPNMTEGTKKPEFVYVTYQ
jgi:hypothetical protein